jgi:L,D-transpeptidase YcbB
MRLAGSHVARTRSFWCLVLSFVFQGSVFPERETEIQDLVTSGWMDELRWPNFAAHRTSVSNFYSSSQYALVWTWNGRPTSQAQSIIQALTAADARGLDPEDYDGSRWQARLSTLQAGTSQQAVSRFDLALTISTIRYASDLHFGRANPKLFHFDFDVQHREYDPISLLIRLKDAEDPRAVLDSLEPPFEGYRRTEKALARYAQLDRDFRIDLLPAPKSTLEPGGSYKGIPNLMRLLISLGDLTRDAKQPEDSDVYGPALVEAVKRFQVRHGLDPDGRIGASTLRHLKTPLRQRVRQLRLTLERWRWVPHEFPRPPIVVNIPEFELRALNSQYLTEIQMRVVVGRAYRHRTPVFSAELKSLIFHPEWNVPLSIVRDELLPAFTQDRFLKAYSDFEILTRQGVVVKERPISDRIIAQLRSGKLCLRQLPGPKNPLGRVKFVLPNDNDIYLHDTASPLLFRKARRDFSHGCIRVQEPLVLAERVLRDDPLWTPDRIKGAMDGSETIQVNVNPPIPVLIVYATAVALEGGDVRFFSDIYGYDDALEAQLARAHP